MSGQPQRDRINDLRKLYARLLGIRRAIPAAQGTIPASVGQDYDAIAGQISTLVDDFPDSLRINSIKLDSDWNGYWSGEFNPKLEQLISLLEVGYNVADKVVEIGSLYNTIKDSELRERCGDLLTATDHFDRVINQATLILEDRLRKKAGLDRTVYGASLASAAINSDPSKSKLVLSTLASEQEGYANIVRGLMQALRNETHHTLAEGFTREDAFSVCGFIDRILRLIDQAKADA